MFIAFRDSLKRFKAKVYNFHHHKLNDMHVFKTENNLRERIRILGLRNYNP